MHLVQNERVKMRPTAMNNVGVAMIVTGVVAPVAGLLYGTEQHVPTWRIAVAVAASLFSGVAHIC